MSRTWTDEAVAILRRLAAERQSATEIGEVLGVSRSTVLGKAHRLKISLTGGRNGFTTSDGRPKSRVHRARPDRVIVAKQRPKLPPKLLPPRPDYAIKPSLNLTIMELDSRSCRWIEGDRPYRYCGHTNDGNGPYCPGHSKLAYNRAA